jgi:glycosyltransferase involved in cell wall biosynthesis
VIDNYSTDNSVEIAKSLGCEVVNWDTGNQIDDYKLRELKNTCWKTVQSGWVIVADMDEWLCVTEEGLEEEKNLGTTILQVIGVNMIGESNRIDLSDVNLHEINRFVEFPPESKKLCFMREAICDINYGIGAHDCIPVGNIVLSSKNYINKHMAILGLPFLIDRYKLRYERSVTMRNNGMAIHYTDNVDTVTNVYNNYMSNSKRMYYSNAHV